MPESELGSAGHGVDHSQTLSQTPQLVHSSSTHPDPTTHTSLPRVSLSAGPTSSFSTGRVDLRPVATLAPGEPSRPPRSPLRPRPPSLSTAVGASVKRRRTISSSDGRTRTRIDSRLSSGSLAHLRSVLSAFRTSLRADSAHLDSSWNSKEEHRREGRGTSVRQVHLGKLATSSPVKDMSIADQRSARRLLDSLLDDLRDRKEYVPPSPPKRAIHPPWHHARSHSLPGSVWPSTDALDHGTTDRRRTMSYTSDGVFGPTPGALILGHNESEAAITDIVQEPQVADSPPDEDRADEALSVLGLRQALRAEASVPPSARPTAGPSTSSDSEPTTDIHSSHPPKPRLSLVPPPPPSPPAAPPDPPTILLPPTPDRPPQLGTSSRQTRPGPAPIQRPAPLPVIQVTPIRPTAMHPFAAVVAMMEQGDSPTRRRASAGKLSTKASQGSLRSESSQKLTKAPPSPRLTALDKGKGKERPPEIDVEPFRETTDTDRKPSIGRKQTPRRGLIGPGAAIKKVTSKPSLPKIFTSRASTSAPRNGLPTPPLTGGATPVTATSSTFLRPAPATPLPSRMPSQRYALPMVDITPTSSRGPSPGPIYAPRAGVRYRNGLQAEDMVEIPRFKLRELNLGIVSRRGSGMKLAWFGLWAFCTFNALLGVFFDVNVIYMLVQCAIHPSLDTNSSKSWGFAVGAYAICWAISLAVWSGWELGFEFYRRWRRSRPAIEPIYFSLPASLYLSLWSFPHFSFLAHIRASPIGTAYVRDLIPETCYTLVQLGPSLLPLLPRAALGVVLLIAFYLPEADVASTVGKVDLTTYRDGNFFDSNTGQLTHYARGVLLAFDAWVAFRLLIVIVSAFGLWASASRPLGGRFRRPSLFAGPPTTPRKNKRKPKSSLPPPRDPTTTHSPSKGWFDAETEVAYAWKDRTRNRIQDAFELCLIRPGAGLGGLGARSGSALAITGDYAWGARRSPSPGPSGSSFPLHASAAGGAGPSRLGVAGTPQRRGTDGLEEMIAAEAGMGVARSGQSQQVHLSPPRMMTSTPEPPRPESTLIPPSVKADTPTSAQRQKSQVGLGTPVAGAAAPSTANSSSVDLFYTPAATPKAESKLSLLPSATPSPGRSALTGAPDEGARTLAPPSAFRGPIADARERQGGDDKVSGEEEGGSEESATDDSAALLSRSSDSSPRPQGYGNRRRSSSAVSRTSSDGTSSHSHGHGHTPMAMRKRSSTLSVGLSRARSTSITLLRDAAAAASAGGASLVRRTRSSTVMNGEGGGYTRVAQGEDGEDGEMGEMGAGQNHTLPKRRSHLGLGSPGGLSSPDPGHRAITT